MVRSLHIRDVSLRLHRTLSRRAAARGMSLRQYTIDVLRAHCEQPTMDEWLDGLTGLRRPAKRISGAEAVRRAREEDDDRIARARRRR